MLFSAYAFFENDINFGFFESKPNWNNSVSSVRFNIIIWFGSVSEKNTFRFSVISVWFAFEPNRPNAHA